MGKRDSEERELKFPVEGLEGVRERLVAMEAERVGPPAFEDNWLLDRQGELEKRGCILRLRMTEGRQAQLAFKGPRRFEGGVKVRVEHEVKVQGIDEARALMQSLGYVVMRRYQKVREEWQLGAVRVALDHTPIGDFVEFEGERGEVVAKRCGFDAAKAERRSYIRLYDDHLRHHPGAPPEMVFP
jgi:predicted adenylyl cyclase CyaB